MTFEQKEKARKLVHRLLDIVLDTNDMEARSWPETGNEPTAFFEYSGHINRLDIRFFPHGWDEDAGGGEILLMEKLDSPALTAETVDAVAKRCSEAVVRAEADKVKAEIKEVRERIEEDTIYLETLKHRLEGME